MPKIVKPKTLNNGVGIEAFKKTLTKTFVAGKKTPRASNRTKLNLAYKKMSKDLTIQKQTAGTSDNSLSLQILHAMGCSVYEGSADMSLITSQTDTETIDNEHIFDLKTIGKVKNSIVEPEDKFSNTDNDPFYTLDESIPITILNRNQNIKEETEFNVSGLVSDIAVQNFSSFGTTTKQFK